MSIATGWDRAAGAMVTQCPSLMDAPSLLPQETLFFSAMYLVGDEMARGCVPGGKGAGQPSDQLSAGDAGAAAGAGRGVLLRARLHVPATRARTGPRQGDDKELLYTFSSVSCSNYL